MTFAISFTDNLSYNSHSQFFYVFYSQIPDEEECLRDRKWWCFLLSSMLTFPIVSLTTFLVSLTHNSSMISIPRYRMRRSACGTGNGGASCSLPCLPTPLVSLTTFLVTLTYNSSMISIPRYRMRRSAAEPEVVVLPALLHALLCHRFH
jgi:hypothetical protein